MSYNPYGGKYTYGGSLKHYRTSIANGGSPNGVRKDGSNPIGKRAVGRRLPDGTYVYDNTAMRSAMRNARTDRENASSNTLREGRGMRSTMRNARTDRENASSNTLREGRGMRSAMRNARTDRENASSNTARDARNKYNNSLIGRLDNATKGVRSAVGDWFNKRRAELKTTGKSVGNWLSDRGRDIGRAAKSAYEAVSNSDERRALERAKANYEKDKSAASKYRYDQAKKAYDSHLLTRLGRGAKQGARNVAKGAKEFWDYAKPGGTLDRKTIGAAKRGVEAAGRAISNQDERQAYERAEANFRKNPTAENRRARNEAKKAYDSHLVTQASRTATKAGRTVSRAASAVGSAAAEGASKAASTATQLANSASSAVNKVITDARRMAGNAVPGASDINKLYDNYKQANQLYNDLLRTDPKAAHKIESEVEDMRKAYVKAESQFNNSTEGKVSNTISGKSKYTNRRK